MRVALCGGGGRLSYKQGMQGCPVRPQPNGSGWRTPIQSTHGGSHAVGRRGRGRRGTTQGLSRHRGHFTTTVFTLQNSRTPWAPHSRPRPLSFAPPNGSRGSDLTAAQEAAHQSLQPQPDSPFCGVLFVSTRVCTCPLPAPVAEVIHEGEARLQPLQRQALPAGHVLREHRAAQAERRRVAGRAPAVLRRRVLEAGPRVASVRRGEETKSHTAAHLRFDSQGSRCQPACQWSWSKPTWA